MVARRLAHMLGISPAAARLLQRTSGSVALHSRHLRRVAVALPLPVSTEESRSALAMKRCVAAAFAVRRSTNMRGKGTMVPRTDGGTACCHERVRRLHLRYR